MLGNKWMEFMTKSWNCILLVISQSQIITIAIPTCVHYQYLDAKPKSAEEKAWEERQKDAPIPIKTFEVDLFANNTFQTVTGLGDTILRGKWSIIGEKRDQLWMKVWRFGFGRSVSGSTFSEGASLSNKDDVAYWGKIYQVDTAESKDDNGDGKSTKIEINGSVMYGVGIGTFRL